MTETTHLRLPLLEAGQAQKHVTHNEALAALDALVMLSVLDRDHMSPPEEPEEGARYIVKPTGSGAFGGQDDKIAHYLGGGFTFHTPRAGWLAYIEAENALAVYNGESWSAFQFSELQELSLLGIGTAADEINPLSAKLNNALFTARETGYGGSGDLRFKFNKQAAANNASLLFQTGYSGRAEIGLAGNDDLTLKVSSDGSAWNNAMIADCASGHVSFPGGIVDLQSGLNAPLYVPDPVGGDIWRFDVSRPGTPRTAVISGVSGATLTLPAAVAGPNGQWGRWSGAMAGKSRYRIWNTSKSPAQSAWVSDSPTTTTLTVTDAAHISGWLSGETIRVGDPNPTGANTLQMVALDIAPYMQDVLGTVFPQKGLFLNLYVSSSDGSSALDFSGTGAAGSAAGGNALSNGVRNRTSLPVPTGTLSPISNSNLLFVRESLTDASDLTITYARVLGFYV